MKILKQNLYYFSSPLLHLVSRCPSIFFFLNSCYIFCNEDVFLCPICLFACGILFEGNRVHLGSSLADDFLVLNGGSHGVSSDDLYCSTSLTYRRRKFPVMFCKKSSCHSTPENSHRWRFSFLPQSEWPSCTSNINF